jgi:hypothetical protein
VLANWLTTAYSQQFISHICYLTQPGRESSRIEVEDISDDRLLFGCSKLLSAVASFKDMRDSVVLASQCRMRYVKRLSSALEASKLSYSIGRTGKLDSAFSAR